MSASIPSPSTASSEKSWIRSFASNSHPDEIGRQGLLPLSLLLGSFAWSFVYVTLPFHIQRVSPFDTAATLRWTGWILGISPLVTVATAPLWGRWAGRGNPKTFYVVIELLQGVAFLGMALARTLPELFAARLILGIMGAASTFAFIMAGRAPHPGAVRRHVARIQSAMTVGQVLGPLLGALAADRVGFRGSFVMGAGVLWVCAAVVAWGVPSPPPAETAGRSATRTLPRDVAAVCLIVLGGSTHLLFLAAVLPQVIAGLGVAPSDVLVAGGVVVFGSGVAAALGSLAAPRLAEVLGDRWLIVTLLAASSALVLLLAPLGSLWGYGVVRFLQVLCIAPVFPVVVARIAQHASGDMIGLVNSARIGAAFIGPVIATTVLSVAPPVALYAVLASIGLACVPVAIRMRRPQREDAGTSSWRARLLSGRRPTALPGR
jgi:MFS transporter, DHA1 family, multidrug resistance protein